ncbi:hypothetical protein JCM21900_002586 [Sporobolomyces salmonicolor]
MAGALASPSPSRVPAYVLSCTATSTADTRASPSSDPQEGGPTNHLIPPTNTYGGVQGIARDAEEHEVCSSGDGSRGEKGLATGWSSQLSGRERSQPPSTIGEESALAASPHLTQSQAASPRRPPAHFASPLRQRLPSLAPSSSSSSAITYVDVGSEDSETLPNRFILEGRADRVSQAAQPQLQAKKEEPGLQTGARAVPRWLCTTSVVPQAAPSSRFGAGGALPSRPSQLPSVFDSLSPAAFTLRQPYPATSNHDNPSLAAQPRATLRPVAPSRCGTISSASQRRTQLGPKDSRSAEDLLASFISADQAIKENRPLRQRRRVIEQEESEEEVQVEKVRGPSRSDTGRSAPGEHQTENGAAAPGEIGRRTRAKKPLRTAEDRFSPSSSLKKRRRSRAPTRALAFRSDRSSSPPLPVKRGTKKAKSTSTSKDTAKPNTRTARSRIENRHSSSGSDRTLTTEQLLKLLPKRAKVFGKAKVHEREEAEAEAEAEMETDYDELVSQRARSTHTSTGQKSSCAARTSTAAGRNQTTSRRGKKKQQREDSDREEDLGKQEAAKRKWAELDAFEMETELTL